MLPYCMGTRSTGSEAFSLFICLDTTKFVSLIFFSPIKTIYLRVSTKLQPNAAKSPLPVDVRRSKTLLLKLPNDRFDFSCFMLVLCDLVERFHSVSYGGHRKCPSCPQLSTSFMFSCLRSQIL